MSSITTAQVVERLKLLTPDQIAIVYDFAGSLAEQSSGKALSDLSPKDHRVTAIAELRSDFWPADESVDEFLAAHEAWRIQDIALETVRDRA